MPTARGRATGSPLIRGQANRVAGRTPADDAEVVTEGHEGAIGQRYLPLCTERLERGGAALEVGKVDQQPGAHRPWRGLADLPHHKPRLRREALLEKCEHKLAPASLTNLKRPSPCGQPARSGTPLG